MTTQLNVHPDRDARFSVEVRPFLDGRSPFTCVEVVIDKQQVKWFLHGDSGSLFEAAATFRILSDRMFDAAVKFNEKELEAHRLELEAKKAEQMRLNDCDEPWCIKHHDDVSTTVQDWHQGFNDGKYDLERDVPMDPASVASNYTREYFHGYSQAVAEFVKLHQD